MIEKEQQIVEKDQQVIEKEHEVQKHKKLFKGLTTELEET